MPNIERLEAVMQFILDHPELHDQAKYTCGTAACFAGHATWMFGTQDGWRKQYTDSVSLVGGELWVRPDDDSNSRKLTHTHQVAQQLLGLSSTEACNLFYARNTVDDLQRIVKEYANAQEAQNGG